MKADAESAGDTLAWVAQGADFWFYLPCSPVGGRELRKESKMTVKNKNVGAGDTRGAARRATSRGLAAGCAIRHEPQHQHMVAEAAYFRAEQRGFSPGHEMSDWLQAEADIEKLITGQA
jgi:hypothetical protein